MLCAGALSSPMMLRAPGASAAEIQVFSGNGIREVLHELSPQFERTTGHKVTITFATVGVLVKRLQDGETADVVIIPRQGFETLIKDRKVSPNSVAAVAHGGIGIAVRKGTPKPDIATPEALKAALLAAKSITYLDPAAGGTSGPYFARLLERLGIAEAVKSKTVLHRNAAAAAALLVNGEADIGVNLIQEFIPIAGVELVGPLPADLQLRIDFAAAVTDAAKDAAAAKALVDFLRTPDAAAVIKAKGMEPG
jgi:molybdate transport system substrate-binding protein